MAESAQEDDLDIRNPVTGKGEVNSTVGRVEYDMDKQDETWLEEYTRNGEKTSLNQSSPPSEMFP
jgi:NuA3 HAT complex component NTO1